MVEILLLLNLVGFSLTIYFLKSSKAGAQDRREISQTLKDNSDSLNQQLTNAASLQRDELAKMTETLQKRLESLQKDNHQQLDRMRQTVDEKLQSTLEKRLSESFNQVNKQLQAVYQGLGEMQNLASGVDDLQKTLSNVKTRGMWGEAQLGNLLREILNSQQYVTDFKPDPQTDSVVEFALKIPDEGGNCLYLPIDAKFPLASYEGLLATQDEKSLKRSQTKFKQAIVAQAKKISQYINPPKTTDFAIMYLPIEGLYAQVAQDGELVEKLRQEHRVAIAGPTTILPMLNFLNMGYKTLAIQKQSSQVYQALIATRQEFSNFGQLMTKASKNIEAASQVIATASTQTQKIETKLGKIGRLEDEG